MVNFAIKRICPASNPYVILDAKMDVHSIFTNMMREHAYLPFLRRVISSMAAVGHYVKHKLGVKRFNDNLNQLYQYSLTNVETDDGVRISISLSHDYLYGRPKVGARDCHLCCDIDGFAKAGDSLHVQEMLPLIEDVDSFPAGASSHTQLRMNIVSFDNIAIDTQHFTSPTFKKEALLYRTSNLFPPNFRLEFEVGVRRAGYTSSNLNDLTLSSILCGGRRYCPNNEFNVRTTRILVCDDFAHDGKKIAILAAGNTY